jgi:glucose-6-phosphate dehydrogenase assembly protein OpcA
MTARLEWAAESVGLNRVLAQMSEFSEQAAEDPAISLTGSLNVLALTDGARQSSECSQVIEALADAQPSRAIVLQKGSDVEPESSRFSAQCRLLPGADRHVYVEHVTVSVPDSPAMVRSVATRLLRPELPTHLWWPGLPDPPFLDALAPLACRVLTEAEKCGDAREALDALVGLVAAPLPALGDLGWAATTVWRQLLLGLVNEAAWQRLAIGPSRLSLTAGGSCLRAWLIGGWMGGIVGPRLELDVRRSGDDEAVTEIVVETPDGVMEIRAHASSAEVSVKRPSEARRRRSLPLPRRNTAELVAGELELRRRDRPFEVAVARAAELAA